MTRLLTAVFATLALATTTAAQPPDIVGTWDVSFETSQGTRTATMTIQKEAGKLSALISAPTQGDFAASVTQKDATVNLEGTLQTQNGPVAIVMTGTVNGNAIKGSVSFGGGSAEWSATRKATEKPAQSGQTGGSQEKPAPSMNGSWAFEVQHSAGTSTPTVSITQTGEKLGGKYVSTYGQFDLTGSTKGTEFTFSVEVGTEQKVTLVYTGTLSGDTVKGSVTMGEMGEGTFTGKRK